MSYIDKVKYFCLQQHKTKMALNIKNTIKAKLKIKIFLHNYYQVLKYNFLKCGQLQKSSCILFRLCVLLASAISIFSKLQVLHTLHMFFNSPILCIIFHFNSQCILLLFNLQMYLDSSVPLLPSFLISLICPYHLFLKVPPVDPMYSLTSVFEVIVALYTTFSCKHLPFNGQEFLLRQLHMLLSWSFLLFSLFSIFLCGLPRKTI